MLVEHLSNDNLIESHKVNGSFVTHHPAVQILDRIFGLGKTVSKTVFKVLFKVLSFNEITESSKVRKSHGHSVGVGYLRSCVEVTCFRIAQHLQISSESQIPQIKRLMHDGSDRPSDFENLRGHTDALHLGIRAQQW